PVEGARDRGDSPRAGLLSVESRPDARRVHAAREGPRDRSRRRRARDRSHPAPPSLFRPRARTAVPARAAPRASGSPARGRRPLDRLCSFLFEGEKFRGNSEDYYDPRNSCLNDVLDRRLGIPITLAVVVMEVGRRVGLDICGIGFFGALPVAAPGAGGVGGGGPG